MNIFYFAAPFRAWVLNREHLSPGGRSQIFRWGTNPNAFTTHFLLMVTFRALQTKLAFCTHSLVFVGQKFLRSVVC